MCWKLLERKYFFSEFDPNKRKQKSKRVFVNRCILKLDIPMTIELRPSWFEKFIQEGKSLLEWLKKLNMVWMNLMKMQKNFVVGTVRDTEGLTEDSIVRLMS